MSETPPNEPRGSRLLLALQGAGAVMGTVLIVWLSFPDMLAWARSPEGLDQSTFWAWLTAVWVAASPAMLAISAWLAWRDGRSARDLIAVAFILAVFGAILQRGAGGSWAEILCRPPVLALMIWILRPDPGRQAPERPPKATNQ